LEQEELARALEQI